MPIPSEEVGSQNAEGRSGEWAARTETPRRSVFPNFPEGEGVLVALAPGPGEPVPGVNDLSREPRDGVEAGAGDVALSRAFLFRYLACGFEDPSPAGWEYFTSALTDAALDGALGAFAAENPSLVAAVRRLEERREAEGFEEFQSTYLSTFGHAARGQCPMNEIEYGDLKADPLFQPHRLADLAAFYRAFGLELAEDATERHDHLCLELEFLCVLAAKEVWALQQGVDREGLELVRDAQKKFLREHLGRWSPAFARRLRGLAGDTVLGALADLLRIFVESECRRFGVPVGSEDLLLRPVDESTESLCASCGVRSLPPGALPQGSAGV